MRRRKVKKTEHSSLNVVCCIVVYMKFSADTFEVFLLLLFLLLNKESSFLRPLNSSKTQLFTTSKITIFLRMACAWKLENLLGGRTSKKNFNLNCKFE
jgi:hypothetical protein